MTDRADVPGARLHYDLRGDGPPLVLLHGFGLDLRCWDAQVTPLSARHRVLRYDLRGFGQSSLPDTGPYSHADDLAALMDRLGLPQAVIVGLSMGGRVALNFALEHKARVRALVLVDASLNGHRWSQDWTGRWLAMQQAGAEQGPAAANALWLDHPLFAPAREQPAVARDLARMLGEYSGWHWHHRDPHRPSPFRDADQLDQVTVPTLVMAGSRDLPDFLAIARTLGHGIFGARSEMLEGVGHLANMEAPDRFDRALASFLDGG